ncbi:type III secretion system translocon subunit SctE [Enterobacter sp. ENT03]|uniref:type III secretion system translocon subunit SctE n=1 Tax=Enterobacter sp. ENT03 TaxID=2854780 RepID=UPI00210D8BE0|nr:type III secretion system translocon subunit SctE [Enterobacter sp. ENT03]
MNGITNNPLRSSAMSNDIYQEDVSANAKSEAVKISSEQMDAARQIIENKVITQFDKSQNNGDTLKPSLRAPLQSSAAREAQETVKKGGMETYNELMAKLITLLGDQSIDDLQARAEMYTQHSKEFSSASQDVLQQIDNEERDYTTAKIAEKTAMQDVIATEQIISNLQQEIQSLLESKLLIENRLSDPDISPDEISALKAQLTSVNSQLMQKQTSMATQQLALATARQTLTIATNDLSSKADALRSSLNYLDSLNKNAAMVNDAADKSVKGNAGTAALLMAQLIAIIGESTEETMELNLKFSQKVQAAQQEKLANDAEEVEKQQEKSRQMQETMGCIGKIIGAIVTIVSVVAAVFSGGASIALAAIGIAMMVADTVYQKVTGNESFIAAALKPIMEHVLMPIIQLITDAISKVLETFGIKNDIAEIIASVLAVVVLIVVAIGAAVVAKQLPVDKLMNIVGNIVKKVISGVVSALTKALKPLITGAKSLTDDLAAALSKLSKSLTNALNQFIGNNAKSKMNFLKDFFSDEVKVKTLGNKINLADDLLKMTDVSIDSAGNIAVGTFEKRINEMLADITRMLSASATMKLFSDSVTDTYSRSMENMNMLMTNAADMAGEEQSVGRFILAHSRA